jgi:hypothetical protein
LFDNVRMMDTAALFDAHGCLNANGLESVRNTAPGRAPDAAAAHLAGCARCQRRLLTDGAPGALHAGKPRPTTPPPLWRTGIVVVAAVLLLLCALATVRYLNG